MSQKSPLWKPLGVTLLAVASMTGLRYALKDVWGPGHTVYALLIIATLVSASYGGLWQGLLATVLGGVAASYLFLEHSPGFAGMDANDLQRLSVYTVLCLTASLVIEVMHNTRRRLEENEHKLIRQIAERIKMEQQLQAEMQVRRGIEWELKLALEKAESANAAKSDFLANMSHEIRTPMNAVVGIANILAMGRPLPAEKHKELLQTLQVSAQALISLIDDLLDITQIESGRVQISAKPFELKPLVQEVIAMMSVRAKEKNITLSLVMGLNAGTYMGDAARVRQVLLNLVGNAVKFTEKGTVTLRIHALPDQSICFEVSDTGVGIAEENLNAIFNKFSQADSSIKRRFGGTGLGLAITRNLAQLMGGSVAVQSKLGQGSVFRVALPLKAMAEPQAVADITAEPLAGKGAGQKPGVLLVEDYQANILIASTILEEIGCDYTVAKNGHEAIALVHKRPFDLILMDIQMPGMDGYEAVQRIRAYEKETGARRATIIGVSAHAFHEDRAKSLDAGMDAYVSKPYNLQELKSRILSLVFREQSAA